MTDSQYSPLLEALCVKLLGPGGNLYEIYGELRITPTLWENMGEHGVDFGGVKRICSAFSLQMC